MAARHAVPVRRRPAYALACTSLLCALGSAVADQAADSSLADAELRALPGLPSPLTDTDFRPVDADVAALGRLLFFDPLLSGNRNIACATCHHPTLGSADGLSLGIGEGGLGLGERRRIGEEGVKHRVPRHAPALFNLGAHEFEVLFHDGRVSVATDEPSGFDTPAEEFLPEGLDSVLAAQALFPLLAEVEMAGALDENEVAGARRRRADYGWRVIVERLRAEPGYVQPFDTAWPGAPGPAIAQVGNALAAFMEREWRADGSAFDAWLRGDDDALDRRQKDGLALFYGAAGCAACHAGALQTDHGFHALGLPPLGPGRVRAFDPIARDVGRMAETDRLEDAYRFRTPSLRNVAHTAPYGHNGSYATLEGILRHHLDPAGALASWSIDGLPLTADATLQADDLLVFEDARELARYRRRLDIEPLALDDADVQALVAFLHALTDTASLTGALGPPARVPSGLPVD